MKTKLHLLRQAQALAAHGSFSRAAEELQISQPALSRGIKELEHQVGLLLFNRSRSGHELTDFGRVFMQHASDLLAGAGDLEREVALAKGLETGEIAVGVGPYVAEVLAPMCAAAFAAAYPGVRVKIVMDSPAAVTRLVRTRIVDLGVAESSVVDHGDDLDIVATLAPLPGYVVVREGHPLTAKAQISIADVLHYPFAQVVMLPPRVLKPMLASRRTARAGSEAASPPFPAIECPTLHFASKVVASSNAFTLATLGMVRANLERREVVPVLHEPWMGLDWAIVRRRKRTMSPAMTAFAEQLERAHAVVLREEALLHERWYRVTGTQAKPTKPRRPSSRVKPRRAAHESFAGKRR